MAWKCGLLRAPRVLALPLITGSFFAGCDEVRERWPFAERNGAAAEAPPAPPIEQPVPESAPVAGTSHQPDAIYYDLTRFEWYAHGEPLQLDGARFEPIGNAIALEATDMQKVGTYAGVDVYRREAAADTLLYVPVFEGFWLPFVRIAQTDSS